MTNIIAYEDINIGDLLSLSVSKNDNTLYAKKYKVCNTYLPDYILGMAKKKFTKGDIIKWNWNENTSDMVRYG